MKISLTQGKFAIVGPKDYTFLIQWKWYYVKSRSGEDGYAVHYENVNNKQQRIYMHRVILERMGFKDFAKSDHINRNKLDNCRRNLRPVTNSQSNCNQNKRKDNTSGYTGVILHKPTRKWQAKISVNGKIISLKYHDNPEEAARAYNKAALKYHGEFAVLNQV